jgi:hypothetical protein
MLVEQGPIVFRNRIVCNGRRTNRIGCPLERLKGVGNISFDKCKTRACGHVRMLTERGVYCTFPSSSTRKKA